MRADKAGEGGRGRAKGKPAAVLNVHVQPRAKRSEIVGRHADAIKVRLKAPPVDGAANDELVRFLAEALGVARGAVTIVSGSTSRSKRIAVAGLDVAEMERRLIGASPSHS